VTYEEGYRQAIKDIRKKILESNADCCYNGSDAVDQIIAMLDEVQ
jgi:hypothetical protein